MLTPWTAFEHVADCVVVTDIHGHVKRDHIQEMHLANRAAGQSESLSRPA